MENIYETELASEDKGDLLCPLPWRWELDPVKVSRAGDNGGDDDSYAACGYGGALLRILKGERDEKLQLTGERENQCLIDK